ncbi:MAG: (2Fe-2S)-binding protein [Rhodospirillales bacterium]|nr:(2Fe-2S)-binding protein [Rhodospirillales bacterium]
MMDICPCNRLSEDDVEKAVAAGASTLEQVFKFHDTVIYCSSCLVNIDEILFRPKS